MKNFLLFSLACFACSFLSAQIQTPVILHEDTTMTIGNPGLWLETEEGYGLLSGKSGQGVVYIEMDTNFAIQSERSTYLSSTLSKVYRTEDAGILITGYRASAGSIGNASVIRLDSMGAPLWQAIGGPDSNIYFGGQSIIDAEGNILVAGTFRDPDLTPMLSKFDPQGNLLWEQAYSRIEDGLFWSSFGEDVEQLPNGDYFFLGAQLAPDRVSPAIWLLRTNSLGDSLSSTYLGAAYDQPISLLKSGPNYLLIVAGNKRWSGRKVSARIWLVSPQGQVLWEKNHHYLDDPSDWRSISPTVAKITKDGGCVLFGQVFGRPTDSTYYDGLYVLKIGPDGEKQWDMTIDHPDLQLGGDILPLSTGGYLLSARHENYDLGYPIVYTYFARLSDDGIVATSRQAELSALAVSLSPNPFEDLLSGSFVMKTAGAYTLSLFDLQGRIVQSQQIHGQSGTNRFQLATAELPAASYVLRISSPAGAWSGKVVKR